MENEVVQILKNVGAIRTNDHFVGVSGLHFDTYVLKDALFPHTKETSRIGELFAERNLDLDIHVVAAPSLGGIILSQWTAFHLSRLKNKEVLGVFTEKTPDGNQALTRGYNALVRGRKVLIVEDATTTGGSVQKVIRAVREAGGTPVALSIMVNRDPDLVTEKTFGIPFRPLAELRVPSYAAEECPFCKKGVPVNTAIGHGKRFLETRP